MGYMRHHAIVITSWQQDSAVAAHAKAVELEMIVTPIVHTPLNGYLTFTVCPDGSNEGWDESHNGDDQRDKLVKWMEEQIVAYKMYWDWVEVQYGDDNGATLVTRSSETVRRALHLCEMRNLVLSEHPL